MCRYSKILRVIEIPKQTCLYPDICSVFSRKFMWMFLILTIRRAQLRSECYRQRTLNRILQTFQYRIKYHLRLDYHSCNRRSALRQSGGGTCNSRTVRILNSGGRVDHVILDKRQVSKVKGESQVTIFAQNGPNKQIRLGDSKLLLLSGMIWYTYDRYGIHIAKTSDWQRLEAFLRRS